MKTPDSSGHTQQLPTALAVKAMRVQAEDESNSPPRSRRNILTRYTGCKTAIGLACLAGVAYLACLAFSTDRRRVGAVPSLAFTGTLPGGRARSAYAGVHGARPRSPAPTHRGIPSDLPSHRIMPTTMFVGGPGRLAPLMSMKQGASSADPFWAESGEGSGLKAATDPFRVGQLADGALGKTNDPIWVGLSGRDLEEVADEKANAAVEEIAALKGLASDDVVARRALLVSLVQWSLATSMVGRAMAAQAAAPPAVKPWFAGEESKRVLQWVNKDMVTPPATTAMEVFYSLEFTTYLARFLINYDADCIKWWATRLSEIPPNLSAEQRTLRLNAIFGQFAASVEYGLRRYAGASGPADLMASLEKQHPDDREACRHLALAFTFLDESVQPTEDIERVLSKVGGWRTSPQGGDVSALLPPSFSPGLPEYLSRDPKRLLPSTQLPVKNSRGKFEVRGLGPWLSPIGSKPGQASRPGILSSTVFGPRGGSLRGIERVLGPKEFALFSLAGSLGCAGTHSAVVPLDVVKTRLQTSPGKYESIMEGFKQILASEGPSGLFLGAAPTLLGYVWYGATVYPGFEFFRRVIESQVGVNQVDDLHAPIVLGAGAAATVVACFGVCPAEVVRIRMVSKPEQYGGGQNLGEALQVIAAEAKASGSSLRQLLYSGFQPLLIRQVIFGAIKFFTFDFCVGTITEMYPDLAATQQSELLLSLGAGLVAGVVSSLVSQPADTVLSRMNRGKSATKNATDGEALEKPPGVVEAVRGILAEEGPAGLYRGAGARCVWSGAIISGQFLLYDLGKQILKVSPDDLTLLLDINL